MIDIPGRVARNVRAASGAPAGVILQIRAALDLGHPVNAFYVVRP